MRSYQQGVGNVYAKAPQALKRVLPPEVAQGVVNVSLAAVQHACAMVGGRGQLGAVRGSRGRQVATRAPGNGSVLLPLLVGGAVGLPVPRACRAAAAAHQALTAHSDGVCRGLVRWGRCPVHPPALPSRIWQLLAGLRVRLVVGAAVPPGAQTPPLLCLAVPCVTVWRRC